MLFLAAAAAKSTTERLRDVPMDFWLKFGLAILILIGVVLALRKIAKMSKVLLGVIVFVVLTFIGFSWIYERNEPAWATPAVQWLAGFFPTKGKQLNR